MNAYEVEAGTVLFAGKAVCSMPERLKRALYKSSLTLPLPFRVVFVCGCVSLYVNAITLKRLMQPTELRNVEPSTPLRFARTTKRFS